MWSKAANGAAVIFVGVLLALLFGDRLVDPALAGFDEGSAAYDRGEFSAALKELKPLATKGDARAQDLLGTMYYRGEGVDEDHERAFAWWLMAGEQEYTFAQYHLGRAFDGGIGVEQDFEQSIIWYLAAAEKGHATAQRSLGAMYAHGKGTLKNPVEAVKWYRKAAEQNEPWSLLDLGKAYENGLGVLQDYSEAMRLYRKAAELGNGAAMWKLGEVFAEGRVVELDNVQAEMWFSLAVYYYELSLSQTPGEKLVKQKNISELSYKITVELVRRIREARDELAQKMTREEIVSAQKLAQEWSEQREALGRPHLEEINDR